MNAVTTLPVAEHRTKSSTKNAPTPSLKPIRKALAKPKAKSPPTTPASPAPKTIIVKAPKLAAKKPATTSKRSTKPTTSRKPKRRKDAAHRTASAAAPSSPLVAKTYYVVITDTTANSPRVALVDWDLPRCERYVADFNKSMEPDTHLGKAELFTVDVALPIGGVAASPSTPQANADQPTVDVELYALILQNERGAWIDKVAIPNCSEESLEELQIEADLFGGVPNGKSAVVVAIKGRFPMPQPVPRPIPQINLNDVTRTTLDSPNFEAATDRWYEIHNGEPRLRSAASVRG